MTDNILEKLQVISAQLQDIETRLTYIEQSTDNMDRHVSFVEKIYSKVQVPFHYIMNAIPVSKQPPPGILKE